MKAGIQPIIGCQLNLAIDAQDPRHQQMHLNINKIATDQLVVLAQNQQGYSNLLRLVSESWRKAKSTGKPYIDFCDLQKGCEGLIALTAGYQGGVGKLLLDKQKDAALACLTHLKGFFDRRLYIELSRLGLPQEHAIEEELIN